MSILDPRVFRECLRLILTTNFSNNKIKNIAECSPHTVKRYRSIIRDKGFTWAYLNERNDEQLKAIFRSYSKKESDRPQPEVKAIVAAIESAKGKTTIGTRDYRKRINHWIDYRRINPDKAYSLSHFNALIRQYIDTNNPTILIEHKGGEAVQIDFAGKRLARTERSTGKKIAVEFFVATLPASKYTFFWFCESQKIQPVLDAFKRALEDFGGVPQVVISDNFKAAIVKSGLFAEINRALLEFLSHYQLAIDPAKPGYPEGKAIAENHMRHLYTWVYSQMQDKEFYSVEEMNVFSRSLQDEFNNRSFSKKPGTPRKLFERIDKQNLRPLPPEEFEYGEWVAKQKVDRRCHITVKQHEYSIPHTLIGEVVEARMSLKSMQFFHLGKVVATHPIGKPGGRTTCVDHFPKNLTEGINHSQESALQWAESIGEAATELVKLQFDRKNSHPYSPFRAVKQLKHLAKLYDWNRFEHRGRKSVHTLLV